MSPALTRRIIDFFEYKTSSTRSIMSLHALEELPYQLQVMLYIQLHKGLITRCPIFQPLPELAVMEMMRRLKPEVYPPATLIIQEGTVSHRLYFISEGVVDVWHNFESPTQRTKISTLTKNGFFGEQSLMQERTRSLANATVQTVSFCDVLILSGDDFDEVLYIHMKYNPVKAQQAAAGATGLSGPSPNQSKTSCSRTSYSKTSSSKSPSASCSQAASPVTRMQNMDAQERAVMRSERQYHPSSPASARRTLLTWKQEIDDAMPDSTFKRRSSDRRASDTCCLGGTHQTSDLPWLA